MKWKEIFHLSTENAELYYSYYFKKLRLRDSNGNSKKGNPLHFFHHFVHCPSGGHGENFPHADFNGLFFYLSIAYLQKQRQNRWGKFVKKIMLIHRMNGKPKTVQEASMRHAGHSPHRDG
ncbi:MAG: hypothetical protein KUL80_07870 [Comamonas sp.]|nr:hypothetical protein [Comamonas sp.]